MVTVGMRPVDRRRWMDGLREYLIRLRACMEELEGDCRGHEGMDSLSCGHRALFRT